MPSTTSPVCTAASTDTDSPVGFTVSTYHVRDRVMNVPLRVPGIRTVKTCLPCDSPVNRFGEEQVVNRRPSIRQVAVAVRGLFVNRKVAEAEFSYVGGPDVMLSDAADAADTPPMAITHQPMAHRTDARITVA